MPEIPPRADWSPTVPSGVYYDVDGKKRNADGSLYNADRDSQSSEARIKRGAKKFSTWLVGGAKGDDKKARASADALGGFADDAQASYGQTSEQMDAMQAQLAARAQGQGLVAPSQMRAALGQIYGQQASAVASASPRNSPMLARQAMIEGGLANMAAANQGAIAGAQEQQQAQLALGQLLAQRRALDAQAVLQARGAAQQTYAQNAERDKGFLGKYGGAIASGLALFSDRNLKADIQRDDGAAAALSRVGSYSYRYRDGKHGGRGRQRGIMAQDLERAGLGHAVIDTPAGKVVHGAKLAATAAAGVGELARRIEVLERKQGARRG